MWYSGREEVWWWWRWGVGGAGGVLEMCWRCNRD